jgi:triacylglycerol lipase
MFSKLVCSVLVFYFLNILFAVHLFAQADSMKISDFSFTPPKEELNCMQYFTADAEGVDPVNTFILAKFSEMMYLERIDYQLRYMKKGQKTVSEIPYSEWLKEYPSVTNENFATAFRSRFQHYFFDPATIPPRQEVEEKYSGLSASVDKKENFDYCFWQDSIAWAAENMPEFKFIHRTAYLNDKKWSSLDPELMIVSTQEMILIVFRGTDPVAKGDDWGEWIGTDFRIGLIRGGGNLVGTRLHKGFWQSFDLVRDEIIRTLDRMDAKHKKIWLTGHSLGGAMAILAGAYLKSEHYPVANIYAFAAPRVVGDKKFTKKLDELLPNRVQRFEYYLDPITLLWAPRYRHAGQRNWFDDEVYGNYELHIDAKERYMHFWPFHFNRHPFDKRKQKEMRVFKEKMNGFMAEVPFRFYYHNPQYYVKAAYKQLTEEQKAVLPAVDDSFPYLYGSAKGPMPGTK